MAKTRSKAGICSHQPDADEPRDEVELVGFAPVNDEVVAEITECQGALCPKSSGTCDTCGLCGEDGERGEEVTDDEIPQPQTSLPEAVQPSYLAMNRHMGNEEFLEELYSAAPTARGARATVEGSRMKNFFR